MSVIPQRVTRWLRADACLRLAEDYPLWSPQAYRLAQLEVRSFISDVIAAGELERARHSIERFEWRLLCLSLRAPREPEPSNEPKGPRKRGMTFEEAREHKRRKHKRTREARLAANLCTSCGRARDAEGVTCAKCLKTDKKWRGERAIRERTAEYLDDDCQPLVLKFPTRMLPVLGGPRYECLLNEECLDQLIKACGRQDPPGASCPEGCAHIVPIDRRRELFHRATTRAETEDYGE
jgi:ferredoxin